MQTETSGFTKILRSYLGFLEGTGKSRLTIASYRGDLDVFRAFLEEEKLAFEALNHGDFDRYHDFLIRRGLKTNTRRRKLITARSLCRYALTRKKIDFSPAQFVKPPERMEKLPWIPSAADYEQFLLSLPDASPYMVRNRLLVEMIAEMALSVSELCTLRWQDFEGASVLVPGKRARRLAISRELTEKLAHWQSLNPGQNVFPGYNRHGIATERMSPRGVELLFHNLAKKSGFLEMTPKTLRHFAIVEWLREGVEDKEIQRRLGVSDSYSLQHYRKWIGPLSRA